MMWSSTMNSSRNARRIPCSCSS
uniref:Uncharacterized protein n=1 Tax=Anguilla anguilla TaxID=7936 RepID=A0A0E9X9U3_ANGAN